MGMNRCTHSKHYFKLSSAFCLHCFRWIQFNTFHWFEMLFFIPLKRYALSGAHKVNCHWAEQVSAAMFRLFLFGFWSSSVFFLFSLWTLSGNAIYSPLFTNVYPLYWFLLKTFVAFGWKHPVLLTSMWIIYLCPNVKSDLTKSPPCSPPCSLAFPVSIIIKSVSLCLLDVGGFATVQWELFNLG